MTQLSVLTAKPLTSVAGNANARNASFFDCNTCPGDIANGDRTVNVDDLNVVLANWFTPQISGTNGDLNGNGFVTVDDLNIVLSNFSHNCS